MHSSSSSVCLLHGPESFVDMEMHLAMISVALQSTKQMSWHAFSSDKGTERSTMRAAVRMRALDQA